MDKRATFLLCAAVLSSLGAGAARADLIAYYPFDEGSGTTVTDTTGRGNNGTFNGNVEWVPGHKGGAVRLDTAGERIPIGTINPSGTNNAMTLAAWIKWEGSGHATITHQGIFGKRQGWTAPGETVKWFWEAQPDDDLAFRTYGAAVTVTGALANHKNEWTHVALTWKNGTTIHYVNGVQVHSGSIAFNDTSNDVVVTIGCVSATNSETFVGSIDEARIYDEALDVDNLVAAMKGIGPEQAYAPEPADGALFGETWAQLKWKPGAYVTTHDVYLGTSFDDVNQAAEGTFIGRTTEPSIVVGVPNVPIPDGLAPGTTYYWRVDEVNDANPNSPWRGQVWSFRLPPRTANEPDPADGAPYALPTTKPAWSAGFKALMRTVYFGTDANEVAKASNGFLQIETSYDPGPLPPATAYYWRVDEFDGTAWRTGPVWSFTTLPEVAVSDPALIGWWTFDEGAGAIAVDWSGHGNHGTLRNGPRWVGGYAGGALDFDGINDFVFTGKNAADLGVEAAKPKSVTAWVYTRKFNNGGIFDLGARTAGQDFGLRTLTTTDDWRVQYWDVAFDQDFNYPSAGAWVHFALVYTGTQSTLYANGVPVSSEARVLDTAITNPFQIGAYGWLVNSFNGLIDDVRLYNKGLTEAEIKQIMRVDLNLAWDLQPVDGQVVDIRDLSALSWKPGDAAAEHDVYLGFDYDAVRNADAADATGIYRGRQTPATYTPAAGFDWGKTCYWRIDEVAADGSIAKGGVRTFTITDFLPVEDFESYTDEEGVGARIYETWLDGYVDHSSGSIVGHLDPPFAERTIVHGGAQSMPFEYNNVDSPWYSEAERTFDAVQDWTDQDVTHLSLWVRGHPLAYAPTAPGALTMSASGVDIWGTADEFRFAYQRLSGNGSIVAKVESIGNTNGWAKGGVMIRETLDPGSTFTYVVATPAQGVSFGWRLSTGNTCGSATQAGIATPQWVKLTRTGNIFTAQYSADGKTWTDIKDANGSIVQTSILMTGSVYIGLCVTSHNATAVTTARFSEVAATGAAGPWQFAEIGVDHPGNLPDSLYISLRDSAGKTATAVHPDPALVTADVWTRWEVPLSSFQGVNLGRVKTLILGVGDGVNPEPGSTGLIYIDDITLTKPAEDGASAP